MRIKYYIKNVLLNRPSATILCITTVLSFMFFLLGVNSYEFSFVGDEWPFYVFARDLIDKNFFANPFSFTGVFNQHAIISSDYQAVFLKLFGSTNFAWRLSNIILIFPLSFFFYLWVKKIFSAKVAMYSTILLQCSFYLANFFKIGYNNPQSLTLFILCLYLAAAFGKRPTKMIGVLLGLFLGISFYIYIGPIFPFLVWPYVLPLFKQKDKKLFLPIILLIITYVVLLLPALFNLTSLSGPLRAMMSLNSSAAIKINMNFSRIVLNLYHNSIVFYKNYDDFYLHFVTGPYLDVISEVLCVFGLIISFIKGKQMKYILLLLTYMSTIIILALISPYSSSPITRGIFLLPFGFLFAGIGLNMLMENINIFRRNTIILYIVFFTVFMLNLYQSQYGVFHDKVGGHTGMALIIKSFYEARSSNIKKINIVVSPSLYINNYTYNLATMQQAYGFTDISYEIIQPNEVTCSADTHTHLLALIYDKDAVNTLMEDCKPSQFTILYPQITYF